MPRDSFHDLRALVPADFVDVLAQTVDRMLHQGRDLRSGGDIDNGRGGLAVSSEAGTV